MSTVEVSETDLLEAVSKLTPSEFDLFIEQALSIRPRSSIGELSAEETQLLQRINRGLPADWHKRYRRLCNLRKRRRLTEHEHLALLELTREAENQDADRAVALVELARLREIPVRVLMKRLGIQTPTIHG
ncbi:MAG: STAS/SEC14 domain-containing protein [Planctomycetes bacterium]|nr:STAS/SEC14 domain-containing protein [Planctomycetota bacterium]